MISFRSFSKSFGAQLAVDGLNLEVARGEVLALLGPNGSGKTTTLKAAAGLIVPSAGAVMLGEPPRSAQEPAAREVLSYLPQKVSFPDALTGREIVEFYRELRDLPGERVPKVMRFASLNGAGERMVGTYSGGMVQRLGLAVAMLPEAPVFLLDEPTAALDPDGLCAFDALVQHAREDGRAVLFTSHQLGDVERLADRFAILVGGRLVACLSASDLKDRLAERGVMRLRFAPVEGRDWTAEAVLPAVRPLAPAASWSGDELIVPGPASVRPRVLDLVRTLGIEVRGLTADEGQLGELYRELVAEAAPAHGEGAK
ncbi:MAG: ABC transporter ATP-binding protein [Vicinamibacteria bacterium]|jgi:Cu-processing system ATP-binding protein|nr:ABC transporter ATP-binding protein [Vicinamibacteria bacterium]